MSLTKDQLIQFMEKPGLLKEQTIGELKEIVDEFPYFQSAQLLYTYNLYSQANFRYASYLKTCSIYATDRTILYRLLQPKSTVGQPLKPVNAPELKNQESPLFELADETQIMRAEFTELVPREPAETEVIDFDLLSFEQPDSHSQPYIPGALSDASVTPEQSDPIDVKSEEKVDLIEQFIKINPTIQPRTEIPTTQYERYELKEEHDSENDDFITETLSRIYLKQGHYQKAIDSFKWLSLKFPEKSVYFAQQIEEIKKLLN
jgi:hypothetical protein